MLRRKAPRVEAEFINLYAAAVRQFLCKKKPAVWQKPRQPSAVTKPRAHRIVEAYFSREHFDDRDGCCPLLGN
jgi:TetR/AcrR family transcriptional regulator, transcriptional repressor for nem operon